MSRFASVSEEAGQQIIQEKDSKMTQKATRVAMSAFRSWMSARGHAISEDTISETELDSLLYQFYLEVRKQDGEMYVKTAYRGMRHGLQRYFKKLRNIDVINDSKFSRSSMAFTAQCVAMKKKGLAKVQHKEPICNSDMEKLYASNVFDINDPKSLQRKVFFEMMYYFCRRAMKNLRNLTKSSFVVKSDEHGVEYVEINIDEFEKNHGAFDPNYDGGIMYATGRDNCPVLSFKKYIDKLNTIDTFFQRPREHPNDTRPWFDNQVLGIRQLEKMMKRIGLDAGLSLTYTNHCIRSTCVSTLDEQGFEARHIMSVSGHRSESSIRAFSRTKIGTKRKMATSLAAPTLAKKVTSTIDVPVSTNPISNTPSLPPHVENIRIPYVRYQMFEPSTSRYEIPSMIMTLIK